MSPEIFAARTCDNRIVHADNLLTLGIYTLNCLASCFQDDQKIAAIIRQHRDVLRLVHERLYNGISAEHQYRTIHPFTPWFTRYSTTYLISITERDPLILIYLMHIYAVIITLAIALPAINHPLFIVIRFRGILEISRTLDKELALFCAACNTYHSCNQLMSFPLHSVGVYQALQR